MAFKSWLFWLPLFITNISQIIKATPKNIVHIKPVLQTAAVENGKGLTLNTFKTAIFVMSVSVIIS